MSIASIQHAISISKTLFIAISPPVVTPYDYPEAIFYSEDEPINPYAVVRKKPNES